MAHSINNNFSSKDGPSITENYLAIINIIIDEHFQGKTNIFLQSPRIEAYIYPSELVVGTGHTIELHCVVSSQQLDINDFQVHSSIMNLQRLKTTVKYKSTIFTVKYFWTLNKYLIFSFYNLGYIL